MPDETEDNDTSTLVASWSCSVCGHFEKMVIAYHTDYTRAEWKSLWIAAGKKNILSAARHAQEVHGYVGSY